MEKIEVIISHDNKTAKEVNKYKEELDKEYAKGHTISIDLIIAFRSEESRLRTFEIDHTIPKTQSDFIINCAGKEVVREIWEAEVLENNKVRIL